MATFYTDGGRFINFNTTHTTTATTSCSFFTPGGPLWFDTGASTITSFVNAGTVRIYADGTDSLIVSTSSNDLLFYAKEHIRNINKQRLKDNLLIKVNHRQRPFISRSPAEEKARNTLRDMLTEQDWRRYITNGFVMVKGLHYWYQIFPRAGVNVYHEGKKINNICIHTDDVCPPTDHVINMMSLIEYDETAVWRFGNVKAPSGQTIIAARKEKLLA